MFLCVKRLFLQESLKRLSKINHLMRKDPEPWSKREEHSYYPRQAINLPSEAWIWEQPWQIELDSTADADKEGWEYAARFSSTWHSHMKANSYVRRRKWIRTRRFIAYNRWHRIRIPQRCNVIDAAVGGVEIMDKEHGSIAVWVLTSQGRILYRQNVHRLNPEGDYWLQIDNPDATDFNQICCSLLNGELLAVSWDGRLFQRTKVCKKMPWGVDWEELATPEHQHVLSIAIGQYSIWAITTDGKVWYTTSMDGKLSNLKWTQMLQSMSGIFLSPTDQVFALGLENQEIYFRSNVSLNEPGGKDWKMITCRVDEAEFETPLSKAVVDLATSDPKEIAMPESVLGLVWNLGKNAIDKIISSTSAAVVQPRFATMRLSDLKSSIEHLENKETIAVYPDASYALSQVEFDDDLRSHSSNSSPTDEFVADELIAQRAQRSYSMQPGWYCVSAGQCRFNAKTVPPGWFSTSERDCEDVEKYRFCSWRLAIIEAAILRNRLALSYNYEFAIEPENWWLSWKVKLVSQANRTDASVELFEDNTVVGKFVLKFRSMSGNEMFEISVGEIACYLPKVDNSGKYFCEIFVKNAVRVRQFLAVEFTSDVDLTNFMKSLSKVAVENAQNGFVCPKLWLMSGRGDVLASSMDSLLIHMLTFKPVAGHFSTISIGAYGITWAVNSNGNASVFTGLIGGGIYYSMPSAKMYPIYDVSVHSVWENQRWSRFHRDYVSFGALFGGVFHPWSDGTSRIPMPRDLMRLAPGWHWIGDWKIDQSQASDPDGWQYARAFGKPFHETRLRGKDWVRRRCWIRKSQLDIKGPWAPLDGPSVKSISVQKDISDRAMYVWAVAVTGDILCRMAVSQRSHIGETWIHIDSNFAAHSISAGCRFRIWATSADDGSTFLRHCTNVEDILSCGWQKVTDPLNIKLIKVAAGYDTVWALDSAQNLYFRTEITDVHPTGLAWNFVYSNVADISVTIEDQLWALLDYQDPAAGRVRNVLARRIGTSMDKPWGTDWEYGIGGDFMALDAQSALP